MILSQIQMFLLFILFTKVAQCTISGISYKDPLNLMPLSDKDKNDACNPLYWYPRTIPEYCYIRNTPKPYMALPPDDVVPLPIPVPAPPAPVFPFLPPMPITSPSQQQRQPLRMPLMMPPMVPALPPPVPFGVPLVPSNPMLPVPGAPFPYPYPPYAPPPPPHRQIGMVPGIRGLVSDDGGINILPFSDAYSDLLENHKNKILRKRLRNLLEDYHRYPRRRRRGRRRHRRRFSY